MNKKVIPSSKESLENKSSRKIKTNENKIKTDQKIPIDKNPGKIYIFIIILI